MCNICFITGLKRPKVQRVNINLIRPLSNAAMNKYQSDRSHVKDCPAYQNPQSGNHRERIPHFKDMNFIPEASRNASLACKCNCRLPTVKVDDNTSSTVTAGEAKKPPWKVSIPASNLSLSINILKLKGSEKSTRKDSGKSAKERKQSVRTERKKTLPRLRVKSKSIQNETEEANRTVRNEPEDTVLCCSARGNDRKFPNRMIRIPTAEPTPEPLRKRLLCSLEAEKTGRAMTFY